MRNAPLRRWSPRRCDTFTSPAMACWITTRRASFRPASTVASCASSELERPCSTTKCATSNCCATGGRPPDELLAAITLLSSGQGGSTTTRPSFRCRPRRGAQPAVIVGLHWFELGGAERWAFETVKLVREAGLLPIVITQSRLASAVDRAAGARRRARHPVLRADRHVRRRQGSRSCCAVSCARSTSAASSSTTTSGSTTASHWIARSGRDCRSSTRRTSSSIAAAGFRVSSALVDEAITAPPRDLAVTAAMDGARSREFRPTRSSWRRSAVSRSS